MKSRIFSLPIMLIIMALIVVACGDDDDNKNINLSQNVSYDTSDSIFADNNMIISIDYPNGWVSFVEYGILSLANNEEALGLEDAPSGDQVGGDVIFIDDASLSTIVDNDDASAGDILMVFAESLSSDGDNFEIGDIEENSVDGVDGAYAEGTITDITNENDTVSFAYALAEVEGGVVIGIFITAEGEISQYADILKAIVASASVATE